MVCLVARELEVGLVQLLDVDVLEREHTHRLHETCWAVHVPDPRVVHRQLEVDLAVGVTGLQINVVGQVEAALGLDDVGELRSDVPVLPIELQLHIGLVVLEILSTHPSLAISTSVSSSTLSLIGSSPRSAAAAARTFT